MQFWHKWLWEKINQDYLCHELHFLFVFVVQYIAGSG